ncbi:MAG: hypothetical protein Q9194_002269 [Teloschistes cf. exilis]
MVHADGQKRSECEEEKLVNRSSASQHGDSLEKRHADQGKNGQSIIHPRLANDLEASPYLQAHNDCADGCKGPRNSEKNWTIVLISIRRRLQVCLQSCRIRRHDVDGHGIKRVEEEMLEEK